MLESCSLGEFVVEFFARGNPSFTVDYAILHQLEELGFVFDDVIGVYAKAFEYNGLYHWTGLSVLHHPRDKLYVSFVCVLHCANIIGTFSLNGKH
jgi:hypothetical protein